MLTALSSLALEVKALDPARRFYDDTLGLPVRRETDDAVAFGAGDVDLVCRRPTGLPRGGLHTHFAFTVPAAAYDDWYAHLDASHDLEEHRFGSTRSLYCYDPDGNCVELGGTDDGNDRVVTGVFEIVLEVESLAAAESFYRDLGFDVMDRGDERRRVRLTGPVDLELWEPQLGIADARGGVHVHVGFESDDPGATVDAVRDRACRVESEADGEVVHVRDPDGHWLTVRPSGA
jgi:catechol-2,3-dioxygenase